jgi:hypothetical protein
MDAKQAATVIAGSLLAALRIALERGELTAENLPDLAHAAANNAAQLLLLVDVPAADADR